MSVLSRRQRLYRTLPIFGIFVWEWEAWRKEQAQPCYGLVSMPQDLSVPPPYPIDMWPLLEWPDGPLDETGVLYTLPTESFPASYQPTNIAQYALANWNAYLAKGNEKHKQTFLTQARWLVANETRITDDAGGWPIPFPYDEFYARMPWLSALTQGVGISVLVRAYRLTGEDAFLQVARRAVRTFDLDILDGGVSAPVGENGIFFEEIAVYPAAHILNGFILSLFGLYDYVALTDDAHIAALIQHSLDSMHSMIDEFDLGYGSRYDLLLGRPATRFYHALHITLLEALAQYSGCEHCSALAKRWAGYQRGFKPIINYFMSRVARYRRALRFKLFPGSRAKEQSVAEQVYVPIANLTLAEDSRSYLARIAQLMANEWQVEYLTQQTELSAKELMIQSFGGKIATPWQFPHVWFYVFTGWRKLVSLLRDSHRYSFILPQDNIFTGAFSVLAAKMSGRQVICMDEGIMSMVYSQTYRAERIKSFMIQPLSRRLLSRLLLACYWPSLRFLGWIAARYSDRFLAVNDEVEETYGQQFGIHPSRIIRLPVAIDVDLYTPLDMTRKMCLRIQNGIASDAIVISMITHLSRENSLDSALQGISLMLSALPASLCMRVHIIIAGDRSSHSQIEAGIRRYGLVPLCTLWQEAPPEDVVTLLGISDIFLSPGASEIDLMAVLKAMATGCAVIALVETKSVAKLLAEGRGIAIASINAKEISTVLIQAINHLALCRQMGCLAREYVVTHHSIRALKRCLLRATHCSVNIAGTPSIGA
jgi:glycosyltransferase involved in cell wall biosynthesis